MKLKLKLKLINNNFNDNDSTLFFDKQIQNNFHCKNSLKNIKLKQHQLLTLSYMEYIEKNKCIYLENDRIIKSNYGYLCDIVGSGKSIIILNLILNNFIIPNNKNVNLIDHYSLSHYRVRPNFLYSETSEERIIKHRTKMIPLSMIVVPHGIINQWEFYLKEFTNDINYFLLKTKANIQEFENNILNLENIQILLVSASKYNMISKYFDDITISRLIIDEVDSITIPSCSQNIDALFTWFISSSINHIKAGITKHTGLICNVMKHNYYRLNRFILLKNDDIFIKESMALDNPIIEEIYCYSKNFAGRILQGFIDERILTMINANANANAINEISSILNIQKTNEKNIVDTVCDKLQIDKKNKIIELESIERMTYTCSKLKKTHIENKQKEIAKINEKIDCIEKRIKDNNIDPITLEEIKNIVITKCCQNKFEMESILKAIKQNSKCPYCRKVLCSEDIIILDNNNDDKLQQKKKKLDKYEQFESLLENKIKSKDKILIFSEYNESFKKIEFLLNEKELQYKQLKGTSQTINNIVNDYVSGNLNILLLNAQYYGTGLNLINTDHVILFHKMNKDLENQVIGRAQRIGRNKPLYIWKLLHHHEN